MEARAVWQSGFETRLDDGRGHFVTVDLPVDEGGRNIGSTSLELLVLSLAGCISTIFALVAQKRKLPFSGLSVHLTAERPRRAPTIRKVRGTVEVRSPASREDIDTVLRATLRTCPAGVLFEQARVPVDVTLAVIPS